MGKGCSTHSSLEALKSKPIVKHYLKATTDAIRAFIEARAVRGGAR